MNVAHEPNGPESVPPATSTTRDDEPRTDHESDPALDDSDSGEWTSEGGATEVGPATSSPASEKR
ncbi:hypothetical protein [Nocardioides limicola]|uniref:hypothetical protein n=1 Tax=Nocardioides limicola TaxID=2803368 RepID=UPI00193BE2C1|nr:hypothetical protein [Nocardioides sp. DJM-14]